MTRTTLNTKVTWSKVDLSEYPKMMRKRYPGGRPLPSGEITTDLDLFWREWCKERLRRLGCKRGNKNKDRISRSLENERKTLWNKEMAERGWDDLFCA